MGNFRSTTSEPPNVPVRLLDAPRRPAATLAERSALAVLTGSGVVPLGTLVSAVARDLYRDALRHGGWAAEIGDVGRGLFLSDAARAVREADGILWAIGKGEAERVETSA